MSIIAIRERKIARLAARLSRIRVGKWRHFEVSSAGVQNDVTDEIIGDLEAQIEMLRRENDYMKSLGFE